MRPRSPDLEDWDAFLLVMLAVACQEAQDGWIGHAQLVDVCTGLGAHARRAVAEGWPESAARRGLVRTRGAGQQTRLRPADDLFELLGRLR